MLFFSLRHRISLAMLLVAVGLAPAAQGFIISTSGGEPLVSWTQSASGSRSANGLPITITWGFVPEGTSISDGGGIIGQSDLVADFNSRFGGSAGQTDLTQQPWFRFFQQSFDRWEQLSGVNYVYEPASTSAVLGGTASPGQLGVEPDIRIGGTRIDGAGGTLAFNFVPSSGSDMVIDTDDMNIFGIATDDFVRLRNTIMHEIGHGFGINHVVSSDSQLLMEPTISGAFDGPQLDEVRAVQFFFGDANEKSFGGAGNGTLATATPLGTLAPGGQLAVGTSANVAGQRILPTATDFVSLAGSSDIDVYAFTISQPVLLAGELLPLGGVFSQASETGPASVFNANARNDLRLDLLDSVGNLLIDDLNLAAAGQAEQFADLLLAEPGTYFARVRPSSDSVQLYQLSLTATAAPIMLLGDYNSDGLVDAADYTVWRDTLGSTTTLAADGNGDGLVDTADYDLWRAGFGSSLAPGLAPQGVPEPATLVLLATVLAVGLGVWRRVV